MEEKVLVQLTGASVQEWCATAALFLFHYRKQFS